MRGDCSSRWRKGRSGPQTLDAASKKTWPTNFFSLNFHPYATPVELWVAFNANQTLVDFVEHISVTASHCATWNSARWTATTESLAVFLCVIDPQSSAVKITWKLYLVKNRILSCRAALACLHLLSDDLKFMSCRHARFHDWCLIEARRETEEVNCPVPFTVSPSRYHPSSPMPRIQCPVLPVRMMRWSWLVFTHTISSILKSKKRVLNQQKIGVFPSVSPQSVSPQIIHLFSLGFSHIFTIHFGGFPTPNSSSCSPTAWSILAPTPWPPVWQAARRWRWNPEKSTGFQVPHTTSHPKEDHPCSPKRMWSPRKSGKASRKNNRRLQKIQ